MPDKPGDVIRELARAYFKAVRAEDWNEPLTSRALKLADAVDKLCDGSEALLDYQNGPPLVSEDKEWKAAVEKTSTALKKLRRLANE